MVRTRRGLSSLGCLFTLMAIAVVGYFGVGIGEDGDGMPGGEDCRLG